MRKGIYYQLLVIDQKGQPLTPQSIESQLDWILKDAEEHLGKPKLASFFILFIMLYSFNDKQCSSP
jgi:hypothetical protein